MATPPPWTQAHIGPFAGTVSPSVCEKSMKRRASLRPVLLFRISKPFFSTLWRFRATDLARDIWEKTPCEP